MSEEILNAEALAPERGIVPVGSYPVRMHVEAYRRGIDNAVLTDKNDEPEKLKSKEGTTYWELQNTILDGEHAGEVVFDRLWFDPSSKSLKRVVWLFEEIGVIPTKAQCVANPELLKKRTNAKVTPEQLEETYWTMTVAYSGDSLDADGKPRLSKSGEAYQECKVAFRGYARMDDALVEKYRALSDYPEMRNGATAPI